MLRFLAILSAFAMASVCVAQPNTAPVISDFRSPVVTDDKPTTNSNDFVYPDADDLNNHGHDPDGTVNDAHIIWSFLDASGTYRIDNRESINLATDNPNSPGLKEVGKTGQDDPEQIDNNVRTITYRNVALSPIGGPYVDPVTPGILPGQTRMITLFASDGTTYTKKSFFVYTENNGSDRLSSGIANWPFPPTTPSHWANSILIGSPAMTESGTQGLCVSVGLGSADRLSDTNSFASWTSPYGIISLAKNKVYRIRIAVEGNPAIAPTVTPLWDFAIDNAKSDTDPGESKFGMDLINWDNANSSANSAGVAASAGGRHTFDIWWAPMAIQTPDWNDTTTGEFTAAHDDYNDVRFMFRVLDVPGIIDAEHDAGTLCLKNYSIISTDRTNIKSAATVYDNPSPIASWKGAPIVAGANVAVSSLFNVTPTSGASTTVVNTAQGILIAPAIAGIGSTAPAPPTSAGSWQTEIVTVDPGDTDLDFGNTSTLPDNYPIPWAPDQLLRITVGLQAPDAASETNPPDVLRLTMDSPTNELGMDTTFSAGANLLGMPKAAAISTYTSFFYTQNQSGSGTPGYRTLRPRFSFICSPAILSGGNNVNNGAIRVSFMRVEQIDLTGVN